MTEDELEEHVAKALADGYEIVQKGPVISPPAQGVPFSERVKNFSISMLGTYAAPTYRSQYRNLIFDSETRWVHLRKMPS